MATTQNHFSGIVSQLQQVPQSQRPQTLVSGICQILQQSQNQQTPQELGEELKEMTGQIVKALQQ